MGVNVIQHNMTALFADRQLKITTGVIAKSAEKLSSGYRINRAADDAAGLSISEKMRRQIRGLTQASANLQDGVSLAQVADGALAEVHDMIHRVNELAVKASNGTMSKDDREYVNDEVQALKKEMSRVFRTSKFNDLEIFRTVDMIYNPDVTGKDDKTHTFHVGDGDLGGLEFNNVRYSIGELQALGLSIDDNGVATQDTEAEFDLWDGEHVKISLKSGQDLGSVKRNYTWEAKHDGIYINNKLSAEWSEMSVDANTGVAVNPDKMPAGEYSFTHHGMNISFYADTELNIEELMERINGNEDIAPATWDISAGTTFRGYAADLVVYYSESVVTVTQANKYLIDDDYKIVADENGIAIKNMTTGSQTSYVAWDNIGRADTRDLRDENGNTVPTNGGYPIVDWGTGIGSNDQNDITFGNQVYKFVSPDANVPIKFSFHLNEHASLDEVIAALNGVTVFNRGVVSQGNLTTAGNYFGHLYTASSEIANSFEIQRAYGRNFDIDNASLNMNGSFTVARSLRTDQADVSDVPTGADGTYLASDTKGTGHSVVRGTVSKSLSGSDETVAGTAYYKEEYDDGINGTVTRFYKVETLNGTRTYDASWNATDTWNQKVDVTIDGTFCGYDMEDVVRNHTETWQRTLNQSGTETVTYKRYNVQTIDESDLPSGESFEEKTWGYRDGISTGEFDVNTSGIVNVHTDTVGTAEMTGVSDLGNYASIPFKSSAYDGVAFSFQLSGPTLAQAKTLAQTSGAMGVGSAVFTPSWKAHRDFDASDNRKLITGAQFSNININEVHFDIPPRTLIIQSGADSDDQIEMKWSPLNLSVLGMYNTKTLTQEQAETAIDQAAKALQVITETRMRFGAYQNRFEHAIRMTDNTVENTTYAESMIRDTDMAKEMVHYSNANIIAQAGQAMLSHANQTNNGVLSLLS